MAPKQRTCKYGIEVAHFSVIKRMINGFANAAKPIKTGNVIKHDTLMSRLYAFRNLLSSS